MYDFWGGSSLNIPQNPIPSHLDLIIMIILDSLNARHHQDVIFIIP